MKIKETTLPNSIQVLPEITPGAIFLKKTKKFLVNFVEKSQEVDFFRSPNFVRKALAGQRKFL